MSEESSVILCASCKEPLEAGWPRCPVCKTPTTSEHTSTTSADLTCPNCQYKIKKNWKECPKCLTPLSGLQTPSVSDDSSVGDAISDEGRICFSQDNAEVAGVSGFGLDPLITEGEMLASRYRIMKKLGEGGFGTVYQVDDTDIGRQIALKIVVTGEGRAQRATEQLIHEFNLREKINDTTYVIKAHDPRTCQYKGLSLVLMPMELADGGSLRQWLSQNRDLEKRGNKGLEFFRQACMGVKAIHSAKLIHLDIKPENILLVGGKAKIVDFGIGRYGANMFVDNPEQVKRQGIGTPQYMSPEQFHSARQKDIGPASDIYSLGVVLYELLDGSSPFDGPSYDEYRQRHLHESPPEIKGACAKYWGIVSRCMAKKADDRYRSVEQLIGDLDRVVQGASLSVDVSCPECGHINSDTTHDRCEKCGSDLPETLFRECRHCMKKLRLDTEICPGCGFHVMAYYVLQDRWQQVQKLKDEDPVEAIELLETMLRDGADEHEQKALVLVKSLRKKQSQIRDLIAEADRVAADGEPEKALKAWRAVLKVIPRHRTALEHTQKLERLIGDFEQCWIQATNLMDRGQFEEANKQLRDCLELIPQREKAKNMLEACGMRAEKFVKAYNQALLSAKQTLLLEAQKHAKRALSQAPQSPEALSLADELSKMLEKTKQLISLAYNQLPRAEFDQVSRNIAEVQQMQADNNNVSEIKEQLTRIQDAYTRSMENAHSAKSAGEFERAINALEMALELCPESLEAQSLLRQTEADQEELSKRHACAHELLRKAVSATKAAKFDDADARLVEIDDLCPDVEGLAEAKDDLTRCRKEFDKQMTIAQESQAQKDLERALEAAKTALSVCPKSRKTSTFVKEIEKHQSMALDHLAGAASACKAKKFEQAQTHVRQAETIWPKVPGLGKAMTNLLKARKAWRRLKIKWAIVTTVIVVSVCVAAVLWLMYSNHQHAKRAIELASRDDYLAALFEYGKCCSIPLLVSRPQLPDDVRRGMDLADQQRMKDLDSTMEMVEISLSRGDFEQAASMVTEARGLALTSKEKKRLNLLGGQISDAKAQAEHDSLVTKAKEEYLLVNRIKLLREALRCKTVPSTRQLLNATLTELRRRPDAGDTITNSIGMKLAYIPQGEFVMGSPPGERSRSRDEGPLHRVVISKGFYMGTCEVTQKQYKTIMRSNPSGHTRLALGGNLPVERVSWLQATAFCEKLSRRDGRRYRLPTEAEWEYACRAGSPGRFSFSSSGLPLEEYGWYKSNSGSKTHGVGKKKPNAFGLYDMYGNVEEWCNDWYDDYPAAADQVDPQGPLSGSLRILRGGSYNRTLSECRSAARAYDEAQNNTYASGFRVVLAPK